MSAESVGGSAPTALTKPVRRSRVGFLLLGLATGSLYTGFGITLPLLPRFAESSFGATGSDIGVLAMAYTAGAIACRPLLAWSGRRISQATIAMVGLSIECLAFALHLVGSSLLLLTLPRVLFGLGETFAFLGVANMVNNHAGHGNEAEATARNSAWLFGGLGLGPLIGDALAKRQAWVAGFSLASLLALLAIAFVLAARRFVGDWPPEHQDSRVRLRRTTLERLGIRRASLRLGFALGCLIIGYNAWATFLTPYADEVGVGEVGLLFFAYSGGVLVLRLAGVGLLRRIGLPRVAAISVLSIATALISLSVIGGRLGLWVSVAAIVVGMAQMFPAIVGIGLARVPASEQPVAMSTIAMFFEVGSAISGLTGWIADAESYRVAFAVAGMVTLSAFAFFDRPWFART